MVLGISTWPISDTVLPTLLEVVIQDFLPQSFRLGSRSTHIYIYICLFFSRSTTMEVCLRSHASLVLEYLEPLLSHRRITQQT